MNIDGRGKRFNKGKLRYDLIPSFAQEQYANVLTKGAIKYGDHNWKRGMKWTSVIASLERHLAAVKKGEDYDEETGLLHTAHIMCNAAFLTEYYKIYPQGDNRDHKYLVQQKIGLDIEVLSCFKTHYNNHYDLPEQTSFVKDMEEKMEELKLNKEFWTTMPVKAIASEIPFEPHCYITSRNIPQEWSEQWIMENNLPMAPVYTVGPNKSKVETAIEAGVTIMVDDRMKNFIEFNNNGICCFLFDAPDNDQYNVGHKRIYSLKELQ